MSLRDYELTVVFSPEVLEEQVDGAIEKLSQYITQKEGVIVEVKRWGRRKLAYPIRKFRDGNYVFTQLQLDPGKAPELETNLKSWEEVLRFLLIKPE